MSLSFFVPLPLVPVRKDPSDTAEMITQLLFGDTGQVLDEDRQWRRIRIAADGYEGWVDEKTLAGITEEELETLQKKVWIRTPSVVISCKRGERKFSQRLTLGTRFPMAGAAGGNVRVGEWLFMAETGIPYDGPTLSFAGASALYLGAPYLWGGKSLWGIDCSGLTQMAAGMAGFQLPRDSWQQAEVGVEILFSDHRAGDLAFFSNDAGRVTHTGILLGGGVIRHSHGFVRDDRCTEDGIINVDNNVLTHKLSHIRRIS